ncbi:hypothetical protein AAFF_G00302530 [Aldrovandia affinis]|uniref:Uncharacterized protein n=1 Tax=Aldrovandia affinis TaxID=143900 RepID=A0AAD7W0B6_9TELE|nr:hypothetical protein AAFF_G00302530 [Aldrovandia affinis]
MPALEESEEERPALPRQDSLQQIHEDIINPSRSPESSTPKKNKGKSADCKTSPIINRLRSKFTKTPPRKSLNQLQRIRLVKKADFQNQQAEAIPAEAALTTTFTRQ